MGVSSAVLGLCVPQAQIVSIDSDLPVEAQNLLCLRKFHVSNKFTNLSFVAKLINYLGIADRFTLHQGYFSCCFPAQENHQKLTDNGIEIETSEIIGQRICEEYGPFEVVFLDADHRTAAVKSDLNLLFPYVLSGGIIILHDVGSDYWGEQVRSGVQDFLEQYRESKFQICPNRCKVFQPLALKTLHLRQRSPGSCANGCEGAYSTNSCFPTQMGSS